MEDKIKLNVGGTTFMTRTRTLSNLPDTRLSMLNKLSHEYDQTTDTFYYDRNPQIFHQVLECYRTGELHLPSASCTSSVRKEIEFWDLDLDSVLAACCMANYQDAEERNQTLRKIYHNSLREMEEDDVRVRGKLKQRVWAFLEYPTTTAAKIWICLYSAFVLASLILYVLITQQIHRRKPTTVTIPGNLFNDELVSLNAWYIMEIDIGLNLIFSFELFLRIFSSQRPRLYVCSVSIIIELLCVFCYWFYIIGTSMYSIDAMGSTMASVIDYCLLVQVLRLVRCLRLSKTIVELRALILSLKHSFFEIVIIMIMIFSAVFFYSVMIHYVEWEKEDFNSIPKTLWWAINAVTSVGYGDVTPKSHAGYVVGAMCALSGVLLTGLSVSILSNNLQLYYQYARTQTRAYKLIQEKRRNGESFYSSKNKLQTV